MRTWGSCIILSVLAAAGLSPSLALAAIDPNSGIDFVTIGAVNNPAWTGGGSNNNRGAVGYTYNIGKFEVTTAQWAEFMNAAFDRPANDRIPHVFQPGVWGAVSTTPTTPGGQRWTVPAGREMRPVGGMDWRTCAIYANWLHNGKGTNREAFLSGAYDVSTFAYYLGGSTFTDQLTRSPGARYWIPSLDEWMKAAHYDPTKPNADGTTGGWWQYSNGSDQPFVYGPPGQTRNGLQTTANADWNDLTIPGFNPYAVPLGAYEGVVSPWGLYDVAGGTSEWTEGFAQLSDEPFPRVRLLEGSTWGRSFSSASDLAGNRGGGAFPTDFGLINGFRIASSVPTPGACLLGVVVSIHVLGLRRRHTDEEGIRTGGSGRSGRVAYCACGDDSLQT